MDEVVRIEPLQNEPGLIGYECPSCRYVTSVFSARVAARRFAANLSACDQPRHTARTIRGERVGKPATDEAEHFIRCPACGGWIDCRDLACVFEHEGPLPIRRRTDRNDQEKTPLRVRASSTAGSSTRLRSSASIGKFSTSNASKPSPTQCAS